MFIKQLARNLWGQEPGRGQRHAIAADTLKVALCIENCHAHEKAVAAAVIVGAEQ